jgi:hypothetical protein
MRVVLFGGVGVSVAAMGLASWLVAAILAYVVLRYVAYWWCRNHW